MRVQVLRAWPGRCEAIEVGLAEGACVQDALQAAGYACKAPFTGVAIFGQLADLSSRLHDGDRLELLRPLELDPKEARRRRAQARKQAG